MSTNFKPSKIEKFWLSIGTVVIGCSASFAVSSPAFALDIKAGPIWNNDDAKVKCPVAVEVYDVEWNGQWKTTVEGEMSVCGTDATSLPNIGLPGDVNAGPILNDNDAKLKCPVAAIAANGTWNGQWKTTLPGKMSVCSIK